MASVTESAVAVVVEPIESVESVPVEAPRHRKLKLKRLKSIKKRSAIDGNPRLKAWYFACMENGYLKKGAFKKLPAKGTPEHTACKARQEELLVEWAGKVPESLQSARKIKKSTLVAHAIKFTAYVLACRENNHMMLVDDASGNAPTPRSPLTKNITAQRQKLIDDFKAGDEALHDTIYDFWCDPSMFGNRIIPIDHGMCPQTETQSPRITAWFAACRDSGFLRLSRFKIVKPEDMRKVMTRFQTIVNDWGDIIPEEHRIFDEPEDPSIVRVDNPLPTIEIPKVERKKKVVKPRKPRVSKKKVVVAEVAEEAEVVVVKTRKRKVPSTDAPEPSTDVPVVAEEPPRKKRRYTKRAKAVVVKDATDVEAKSEVEAKPKRKRAKKAIAVEMPTLVLE